MLFYTGHLKPISSGESSEVVTMLSEPFGSTWNLHCDMVIPETALFCTRKS